VDDRQRVSSGSSLEQAVGYSRAVRVGSRVLVAGTAPNRPDGEVDPDPAAQARRCFDIIEQALETAGSSLHDVVRSRVYLVSVDDFEAIGAVHGERLGDARPANTTVVVQALLDPRWKVEIEVEAVIPRDRGRDRR
jgi:enamine deaminase RidA (YjgF/YER057c/UK114 family)